MITHSPRAARWTACGLFTGGVEIVAIALDALPTCLWCASGRRMPVDFVQQVARIAADDAAEGIQMAEDQTFVDAMNASLVRRCGS